jgi:ubiquitin carboxyl-terminal hydrolase 22/27/51
VFTLERERIDLCARLPWMGWKDHPLQRSFDALRFMYILDHGIVWKGMAATYPPYVPSEHVAAASMSRWRQNFFHGNIWELPSNAREDVMQFASSQAKLGMSRDSPLDTLVFALKPHALSFVFPDPSTRWRLPAPVGMYNLGNSCYMSAILQCLIHCIPVQKYFLCDIGHHHMSCNVYRAKELSTLDNSTTTITKIEESCLACELDKLMLNYFDSSTGHKTRLLVKSVANDLETSSNDDADRIDVTGEPLITTSMLTAAWKSVTHLAGYEQRDAHEFLHAFLDALGKHTHTYRLRVNASINVVPGNSLDSNFDPKKQDIFKRLFEGKLRSILVCGKCGNKRTQSEPFMSISLPLAKQVQKAATQLPEETSGPVDRVELSVERCLEHFTCLETLADSVDCPCCGEKTPTRKQHVVSKLPRVLCLHLKRFDAAQNRKIEDYVSFPAKGLNMGPFLPHWCEVSRVPSSATDEKSSEATNAEVLYDLFGTVNHFGNLQSGHYVTNVKVDNKWYHINDAHVSYASLNNGDGEAEVVVSEGAYLLFYIRA